MIAVDTNILVYAHRKDSPHNGAAFRSMDKLVTGRDSWAIPWPCIHEFLAVVTNRKVFAVPTPVEAALVQLEVWLGSPNLHVLGETPAHWATLCDIVRTSAATGGLVHDARIVSLCREHRVRELWTADRDFGRFAGFVTFNPLLDDRVHETAPAYGAAVRARAAGRRRALAAERP